VLSQIIITRKKFNQARSSVTQATYIVASYIGSVHGHEFHHGKAKAAALMPSWNDIQ
jgi:hypothetical protein